MRMQVDLTQAISLLKRGEVVAIPTETVYGLAADASKDEALRQIYVIKQRPADNPLIVHIADAKQVSDFAAEFSPLAQKLAIAFWPGPFTLVLPAKESISKILRGGQPTVALRVPSHPLALQLLQESGLALAAPSANKFTQLSPTTAEHVTAGLGDSVPVLDGGSCKVGIESTIVSVQGENWQLLRLGMVPEAKIHAHAGRPALQGNNPTPKAPGQHLLHYSPRTPIKLFTSRESLIAFAASQKNCAALVFGDDLKPNCVHFSLPNRSEEAAERLYDTLHRMDSLKVDLLLIEIPPKAPEWLAIEDRLTRAAHTN
ncbi:MAG: L-threonylcarbamoyladenylate synthase [Methylophilaceae bacterium]